MKKYINYTLAILGIISLLGGCASNSSNTSGIVKAPMDKNGKKDGISKVYRNGTLLGEISYKNGVRHGMTRYYGYAPFGDMRDIPYRDGKKHGVERHYYTKEQIKSEITYRDDKKHGIEKRYRKNGKLESTIWYKEDLLDGAWTNYYKSAILESKTYYKNGKKHGELRRYSDNIIRSLTRKYYYENGKLIRQ